MTTEYSIQKMVSDGTLSTIALGIQYLQRNDIYMRIAGDETPQSGAPSGYTWSFVNNTTLKILPAVPNGVEVVVYRRTDIDAMYNIYSQNAQFDEATIDENNQQLLYIAQEYLEQGIPGAGVDTLEFVRDDGTYTYYRIKRTDGSYSDEFTVPSAGSATKIIAREALRRSYASTGFNLVAGSFETGATTTSPTDAVWSEATGAAYYKKDGTVGSAPVAPDAGWQKIDSSHVRFDTPNVISSAVAKALIDRAQASKVGINVTSPFFAVDADTTFSLSNVPMSGTGALSAYRKFVIDEHAPAYAPVNTISTVRMPNLRVAAAPVVVIMGDSISTEGPDSQANSIGMWSCIKSKLAKDNPSKNFTFYNRAIGGQTWVNAATKPTAFPSWYHNTARNWLDYIADLAPDVVFLAFGMNDANGFEAHRVINVVNTIKTFTKVPDIVFITNPVPSLATTYPDGTGFGFHQQVFQEGRDFAAGYVRTYARKYGYNVIDINKAQVAMRDSYLVTGGPLRVIQTASSSFLVAGEAANDFAFKGHIPSGAAWGSNVLAVKCGLGVVDTIYVKNTAGKFVVEGFTQGLSTYSSINTNVAIPSGAFTFEISVIDDICRVLLDSIVIAEFAVVRHGGIFLPIIGWQAAPVVSGPFDSITYLSGYKGTYRQTLTDTDIWGVADNTAGMRDVTGGNGINHYSAIGVSKLVRPVIDTLDFSCPPIPVGSGIHAGGKWERTQGGLAIFEKSVTLSAVPVTSASGAIFVSAEIADTDFPAIFANDGALGYKFSVSVQIYSAGGQVLWAVSGAGSSISNAIRYRVAAGASIPSANCVAKITMVGVAN